LRAPQPKTSRQSSTRRVAEVRRPSLFDGSSTWRLLVEKLIEGGNEAIWTLDLGRMTAVRDEVEGPVTFFSSLLGMIVARHEPGRELRPVTFANLRRPSITVPYVGTARRRAARIAGALQGEPRRDVKAAAV